MNRGPRVVCCRKVGGVRPLVLFSPTRFHTEDLGPRLLRLSPVQSHQNKTRERSEKRLVRFVHFPHGQGVGGGIEVMDLVLFRAIIAMGSNWSITRACHVAGEECRTSWLLRSWSGS